jgi:hypothetical protein
MKMYITVSPQFAKSNIASGAYETNLMKNNSLYSLTT